MKQKLSCGIQLSELSELSDSRIGVQDSLPPRRITQLEKHVATCSHCRSALQYLKQVTDYAQHSQETQVEKETAEQTWLNNLLNTLVFETRAGKEIPMKSPYQQGDLTQTEGAIKDLIRNYASTAHALVISSQIDLDIEDINHPCTVNTRIHVSACENIPQMAQEIRSRIWKLLRKHTDLQVEAVNLYVEDLTDPEEIEEIYNFRKQRG